MFLIYASKLLIFLTIKFSRKFWKLNLLKTTTQQLRTKRSNDNNTLAKSVLIKFCILVARVGNPISCKAENNAIKN